MSAQEAPVASTSALDPLNNVHSASNFRPYNKHRTTKSDSQKRTPLRSSRPSTAPSNEKISLLSSIPSRWSVHAEENRSSHAVSHIHALESESDMCLGNLPSPFDEDISTSPSDVSSPLTAMHSEYDWATFINAYATGQWDPHRTPNPPRSTGGYSLPPEPPTSAPIIHERDIHPGTRPDILSHTKSDPPPVPSPEQSPIIAPAAARSSTSTISISPSNSLRRFRPAAPPNLPLPTHRMRSSISTCSAPSPSPGDPAPNMAHLNSEAQTTAATLRWAAARVDISPLALPSPEHELTDPMRGFTASLPGSHPGPDYDPPEYPVTPGGTRKPRLASFWQGTTDVDRNSLLHNETLLSSTQSDSPSEPFIKHPTPPQQDRPAPLPAKFEITEQITAASAPVPMMPESSSGDYFGTIPNGDRPAAETSNGQAHPTLAPVATYAATSLHVGTTSVPALPRRVCLTRQTSSPLPEASHREPKLGGRVPSESITSIRANRSAKEEQMFSDLGYLAPPNPPDELERRRALYKFNIWNTGPDLNFDRIAHLAKLVFSTMGVVISLIDGNEQWHKSEWGIRSTTSARAHSICAHAILQRGDEPMVILDTHKDWRFAKNPVVTGAPHVRFYAGAPLRTADGFNIGALAVICDTPREDFSPRQKHTLKEFAAIAMREMELWRDKMEQFSRECLEIDTEQHNEKPNGPVGLNVGSSMDKVYDRAAKLVKRTLDVEGVIVMDVSHCEVLESMSAEGTVSVNMHFGDPNVQTTKRQLSSEEYQMLNAFFAKYPDGKISEGIVPPSFRPFLPTHIQYALSMLYGFVCGLSELMDLRL
ncbi:hypothetical protein C0991_007391 [Blastosporella zonata]|nr:hypothetical protein C0991_007391 [Blastosporella zonata]